MPKNKFMVGMQGDNIVVLQLGLKLDRASALNLAAWIVALTSGEEELKALLEDM